MGENAVVGLVNETENKFTVSFDGLLKRVGTLGAFQDFLGGLTGKGGGSEIVFVETLEPDTQPF